MSDETRKYALTYLGLMLLLGATFCLAYLDLGPWGLPIALGIAFAKALLVALYFMHLRKAGGVTRIAAVVGVFWLGILLSLSLSDYVSRNWLESPSPWPQGRAVRPK